MQSLKNCRVLDLGLTDYGVVYDLQKKIVDDVIAGRAPQTLVACEHPHVITLGRRANKKNILASDAQLKSMGVGISVVDRGGEVTYHGPGQLVLYPIFDLRQDKKDLHLFLRRLEEVVIRALRGNFGLNALRKKDMTGVWVGPYKVASIGIGVRHWVTYHGLSLNVKTDSKYFNLIKSCGLDAKMASINDFFSDGVSLDAVRDMLFESMVDVFGFNLKKER